MNSGSVVLTRLSPQSETVGDSVHYQIQVPISEGSTHTLDLTNTIPAGMVVLPSSVQISTTSGLSYSGTVTPNITPSSTGIVQGQSQILTYNFTDLVNTDTNNTSTEYITILYDAVVQDSSDTNNGNTIIHTASANYEGGLITKSASALPVTIVEPYLNMTVSNSYVRGYTVPYTFTLTNTGTSTAYDVDLSTLLPAGVTYTGTLTITNS